MYVLPTNACTALSSHVHIFITVLSLVLLRMVEDCRGLLQSSNSQYSNIHDDGSAAGQEEALHMGGDILPEHVVGGAEQPTQRGL